MQEKKKLRIERLEARETPAAFGLPWVDAQAITVSFVQDGTDVSGAASNLYAHMRADGLSEAQWQGEALRALRSWAAVADLDFGVVADSPVAVGSAGLAQGDPRFGDIRISMRPLAGDFLAITTPPGFNSDTLAGDIVLNSNFHFSIGGGAGTYDLFTALLQEGGHSLGLGNSADTGSAMYEWYGGVRAGLGASDLGNIQALYGPRTPGGPAGGGNATQAPVSDGGANDALAAATVLPAVATTSLAHYHADARIEGPADVDFYRTKAPAQGSNLIASVRATDGSAPPALTFFGSAGNALSATDISTGAGSRVYQLEAVPPGSAVFVRVAGTGGDYRLTADFVKARVAMTAVAGGTLSGEPAFTSLRLHQPQFIAFNLVATGQTRVSIYDASTRALVASFDAFPGQASGKTLLLGPGDYDVTIQAVGTGPVSYTLKAETLSDPIGIAKIDPNKGLASGSAPAPWLPPSFVAYLNSRDYYAWLLPYLS